MRVAVLPAGFAQNAPRKRSPPGDMANAAIAEDADNAPAESALADLSGVREAFTGAGGPIPSGASRPRLRRAGSR